jgi:hypothetical protein
MGLMIKPPHDWDDEDEKIINMLRGLGYGFRLMKNKIKRLIISKTTKTKKIKF